MAAFPARKHVLVEILQPGLRIAGDRCSSDQKYPLRPEAEPMRTLGEMDRDSMPAVVENGASGRAKTVFVSLNGPQETVGVSSNSPRLASNADQLGCFNAWEGGRKR
jgi:hypothetical protein